MSTIESNDNSVVLGQHRAEEVKESNKYYQQLSMALIPEPEPEQD